MKLKNVRRKQARRYYRYWCKLERTANDVWMEPPYSVLCRLYPETFDKNRPYMSPAKLLERYKDEDVALVISNAIEIESLKQQISETRKKAEPIFDSKMGATVRPVMNGPKELNQDKLKELFG